MGFTPVSYGRSGPGVILIGVTLVGYEGILSSGSGMAWFGDFLFLAAVTLFALFMVANSVWTITPGQVVFSVTIVSAVIYIPIWLFGWRATWPLLRDSKSCSRGLISEWGGGIDRDTLGMDK